MGRTRPIWTPTPLKRPAQPPFNRLRNSPGPRAAWRLESMGFAQVYDYTAGKLDWLAAGLATEGSNALRPRAGDVARHDVPTCGLDERLGEVAGRVRAAGWDACVVVNVERVVLGLLRGKELEANPGLRIEQAMRPG